MNPHGHTLHIEPEPRRVEISLGDTVLASSDRTVTLHETGLPPRHYVPRDDVVMDVLASTETATVCPFKGQASYWSVHIEGTVHRDLAWSYERPIDGAERIKELVCFFDERVDVTIDGEPLERPVTAWSVDES